MADLNVAANAQNQELEFIAKDLRDRNLEKALSVVAPIDEALNNLNIGKSNSIADLAMAEASKTKMSDFSNVGFSDVYQKYSDDSYVARYDTYSLTNLDQEDYNAKKQSAGEMWGNALPKFLGKVTTNTVGQLGGIVYGLIDAVDKGSLQAVYDNSFMDAINDANTYMDNKLPTYKSKEDREATGLDYWTKGSTYADDLLNGTAFFAGAILSELAIEWATGGAAASTAMARWSPKLAKYLGKGDDFIAVLNSARAVSKSPATKLFATGQFAEETIKLSSQLGRLGELAHTVRFTATSAGYESAFEANAFKKESEANFYRDFEEKNGRMPTVEEELEFRKNLHTAADGLFAFNMALVGSSNLAIMGKWFNVKSPLSAANKWADSKLFGIGMKKVGEEFVETSANKFQKVLGKTYGFAKPAVVEGIWEEGMQSVGQNTAHNWVEAKYNPKYTENSYDLFDSFGDAMAKTYGTAEGWKEIQMGMLIGSLGGTIGNKIATGKWNPEYDRAVAENKLTVDTRNTYSGKRVAEAMAYANRTQQAQDASKEAELKGDFTGQELARQSAAMAQLNFAYNLDYMDDAVEDTVIAIKNLDTQTLMKEYGVDEAGANALKQQMIDEYKETAETYKRNSDFASYYIGNKLSKQEKELLKNHDVQSLREALAYELTLGGKADKFSSDILEAIKAKVATSVAGKDISEALAIEDVLTKAGKETKREAEKKVSQITKLKQKIAALEEEHKKLSNTFYDSASPEAKQAHINRLDKNINDRNELENQRQQLAKEYEILFNAAQLKNPFNKGGEPVLISAERLEILSEQANAISDVVASFDKMNPQEALELRKLIEEYGKSVAAFQRYSEVARQLTDPKLGLRGRRNFISEIKRDKSPSEATKDLILNLTQRMGQAKQQAAFATIEGSKEFKEALEKGKEGATKTEVEAEVTKKQEEKEKVTIEPPVTVETKTTQQLTKDQQANLDAAKSGNTLAPTAPVFNSLQEAMQKANSLIGQKIKVGDNVIEFIDFNGNVLTAAGGRVFVKVKINGVPVTFYSSTGQGGKALQAGRFYPTLGIESDERFNGGWINKIGAVEMAQYYGSLDLAEIADFLDNSFGNLNGFADELKQITQDSDLKPGFSREDALEHRKRYNFEYLNSSRPTYQGVAADAAKIQADFKKITDEIKKNKKQTAPTTQATQTAERKSIKDTIKDMIQNSPYLLEYFGNDVPTAPTNEEIEEFYELAARALDDPKIDNDLIGLKNPYDQKRLTPTTRPSLSKAEINRLQELNEKMSMWQLLEGAQNGSGVSMKDLILQDIATNQSVTPNPRAEVTDNELISMSRNEPASTDAGLEIRPTEIAQVYEDVFVKKTAGKQIELSHFTIGGLLSRLNIQGTISFVQTKVVKGKETIVKGSEKEITPDQADKLVNEGGVFTITLEDGTEAKIKVKKGNKLSFENSEVFGKVMAQANLGHVENTLNKNGGYSPIYDLETGKKLPTDFRGVSEYSPREIYNMPQGTSVSFVIDMGDEYNAITLQGQIEEKLKAGATEEEIDAFIRDNVRIAIVDSQGRKIGDLKANYDTDNNSNFLLIREEAVQQYKDNLGKNEKIDLDKESQVKFVFLGSPVFQFDENGKIKTFEVVPEKIIDYGYIENGELILKNETKKVRKDFIKGVMKKEGTPVIVIKQGEYLIALPVSLKETQANLEAEAVDLINNSVNIAKGVLDLNKMLLENGLSPRDYNLYYANAENQSLFNPDGTPTEGLSKALKDLSEIRKVADVRTWMADSHQTADLVNDVVSPFDMTDNILSSPKPIIDLDNVKDFPKDWYSAYKKTGDIPQDIATQVATKIVTKQMLSPKEYDVSDHAKVEQAIKDMTDMNDDLDDAADDAKKEPC